MRRWLRAPITWIVLLFVVLGWAIVAGDNAVTERCNDLLRYARSTRDTLDTKIACEKMRSDHNTATAIGVAGGLTAGAVAGSRR